MQPGGALRTGKCELEVAKLVPTYESAVELDKRLLATRLPG
jgi:hypothetical protein